MTFHERAEVRRELLQLIPPDVVALVDRPAAQDSREPAILFWIISHGNRRLPQLSDDL